MQPESTSQDDQCASSIAFGEAMLRALGLGQLKHVIGLKIDCSTSYGVPVVHVDMVITQRGLMAVEALLRRSSFQLVPTLQDVQVPIDGEGVLAARSESTACRPDLA